MRLRREALFKAGAAILCWRLLGDKQVSSWDDFLADCARGRQGLHGYRLLPCGRLKDGANLRPVYAVDDTREFARLVQAEDASLGRMPLRPFPVLVDPAIPWKANTVDRLGRALPFARTSATA